MIRIDNISYAFDKSHSLHFPNWELSHGQQGIILGESGSGKSTLLHLISGILKPTEGDIFVHNVNIRKLKGSARDRFRAQYFGVILQKPHLLSALSVEENINIVGTILRKKIAKNTLHELMESLNIWHIRKRKIAQISVGQAQRVAIARAVVHKPKVLVADEPTSHLDDKNTEKVMNLLEKQAGNCNANLIIATHDYRIKSHFNHHVNL